ncbi:ABC transporter ATP-binding protein [Oscillatoria acuminata]|uniref:ABC-type multidrug transport system, ATPase component n=1 Tax=Oscillatoria acuminata PCC 6304 TaxID=56110 RepID=K9TAX3_9CYAN|nr:ABC transporter ATP-binding protein [Oscillatoria acuminata]AFY80042.1 ABC-type multidrug transport system, ATPase component [Oscillatoria acuminata PCC 6304]
MDSVVDWPTEPITTERVPAIETFQLRKAYRTGFWMNKQVETLKNCTLTVYEGETFGLLGPNGAGKTTILKILLGILRPSGGRGLLLGQPLGDRAVRERIGYLPENPYFYKYLTGWEFLAFTANLFQIPASEQRQRIPDLLDLVGIAKSAARNKILRNYSKGMLQRIGMAQALINNPDVVFLDEPMSGLDPLGRYQMREIIISLKEQGKTIFFNSHILADVEKICDRVAILAQGELICSGSLKELLGTSDLYFVKGTGGNLEVLKQWLPDLELEDDRWQGHLKGSPQDFLASLQLMGGKLITIDLTGASLEEFFVQQLRDRGITVSQ